MTRAFTVAWFFHTAPSVVLALPIADFLLWETQMTRIAGLYRTAVSERL